MILSYLEAKIILRFPDNCWNNYKKGTKCELPDETLEGASTTSKREAMIFQASKVDFIVLFFLVILLFLDICSKLV